MSAASRKQQQGFLLITIVILLAVLAAIALKLSSSASMDNALLTKNIESTELNYVTASGMQHANWKLAQNTSCANNTALPATAFGAHSYAATFAPTSGSPVTLTATGTLANGATRTRVSSGIAIYASATTLTLQPGAAGFDAYIRAGANDSNNFGAASILRINNQSAEEASLLRFDLSAIPASAKIQSAVLTLWLEGGDGLNNGVIDMHRVTRSWVEGERDGQAPPAGAGVTYNAYNGQNNWTSPGGDYASPALGTVSIPILAQGWHQWNLASTVQSWASGAMTNHGVLLRASGGSVDKIRFTSGDGNAAEQPKLTVAYACECGALCVGTSSVNLLMVVPDPGSLATQDIDKKTLIESWGYAVSLIDDNASQSEFDTAIAAAKVAYVSATVSDTTLGTKLVSAGIGVVNEEPGLVDEFGYSTGNSGVNRTQIDITNNSHFISSGFSLGLLTIHSSSQPTYVLTGTIAAGLTTLANAQGSSTWSAGLAVLEQGATLVGGGAAAGRRAKLPWGGTAFNLGLLNNDGRTIMKRAIDWAASEAAPPTAPKKLLFVVGNDASLTAAEVAHQTLVESWGYIVSIIDDGASQSAFDAAVAVNDLVFTTNDITASNLSTKVSNATIAIVTSEDNLSDELGFSAGILWESGTALNIDNNTHYITSTFALGSLTVFSSSQSLARLDGTQAPGLIQLGSVSSEAMLVALDVGASLYSGGTAPGRRVQLPWGGSGFTPSSLNANGVTILRRALEWGAGAGGAAAMGPIAHWKLDETSGTTAVDSVGGNNGTLINGPAWATGKLAGGLSFDGNNDYIDVSSMNPISYDDFTVSAWYKSAEMGVSDDEYIYEHNESFFDEVTFGPTDDGTDDRLRFGFARGGSGTWDPHYGTSDIVDMQWHHVVGVRSSGRIKLYVDGAEEMDGVDAHANQTITIDGDGPFIGDLPGNTEQVHGVLDDVRLYDRALTASEILDLFAAGSGGGGGGGGGGPANFGFETIFGSTQNNVRRIQIATQVTLPANGTVSSITAYVGGSTNPVRYAIYSDSSGQPGSLLAQSANVSPQNGMSWVSANIPPTALSAGTYWLALSFDNNSHAYTYQNGGQVRYNNNRATQNGFTSSWGSPTASYSRSISIYATYN